jgi:hypothetical protein
VLFHQSESSKAAQQPADAAVVVPAVADSLSNEDGEAQTKAKPKLKSSFVCLQVLLLNIEIS